MIDFLHWFPFIQYHLCSANTRALLLTTYVKFVNLFPEIKTLIQDVFRADNNLRSADAELQQRASEYLQLSIVASADVLVPFSFSFYSNSISIITAVIGYC